MGKGQVTLAAVELCTFRPNQSHHWDEYLLLLIFKKERVYVGLLMGLEGQSSTLSARILPCSNRILNMPLLSVDIRAPPELQLRRVTNLTPESRKV
jgi:hypothetical protein